jgi:hypothetical protein
LPVRGTEGKRNEYGERDESGGEESR